MPSRVLIWLKPTYLGDAVMAAPLLDELIRAEAEPPVVLAGGAVRQVLMDRTERAIFVDSRYLANPLGLLRQVRELRAMRVQTAIIVNRSFRSALAARLAGIPERVGHATEGRGFLLTQAIPYSSDRFEADCYLDLAETAGLKIDRTNPRISTTGDEREQGSGLLQGATIGFQPGARYKGKQIPIPVLAQVALALSKVGEIALFGGKEEAQHGRELLDLSKITAVNLIGKTTLRETMGAIANLRLMIGSDTGVMHVAAALGCPTVTVFGPNSMEKWGHQYAPHRPIQAPGGDMAQVSADTILAAAQELIARP